MITPYNQRQLNMILDRIRWYENKDISLKKFIDDLGALTDALENAPGWFTSGLSILWGELEDIYTLTLPGRNYTLTQEDKDELSKILSILKKWIDAYVGISAYADKYE